LGGFQDGCARKTRLCRLKLCNHNTTWEAPPEKTIVTEPDTVGRLESTVGLNVAPIMTVQILLKNRWTSNTVGSEGDYRKT